MSTISLLGMTNASFPDYNCECTIATPRNLHRELFHTQRSKSNGGKRSQTKSVIFVFSTVEIRISLRLGHSWRHARNFLQSNFGTVPPRIICNRYKNPSIYHPPSRPNPPHKFACNFFLFFFQTIINQLITFS